MRRERKHPAEHLGGEQYPAHQVAGKKKTLEDQKSLTTPPPLPPSLKS